MAELHVFSVDVLPAHRMVQAEVERASGEPDAPATGARFRAAHVDGSKAWPWTRRFTPDEFPVRLRWAYLTLGDEVSLVPEPG